MRIAVLTNAYPPNARGGAGRIAALQVELLQKRGHEVRVWAASLDWTRLPLWKRVWFHARDFLWVHPAAGEIRAWQPDVLITHNLTGAGFRTPRAIGCQRWVHVLHDVQLFHPLGLLADEGRISSLQRLVTYVRRLSFGRPGAVVSPTHWLLDAHMRRGWFKDVQTQVVPNPALNYTGSTQTDWNNKIKLLFVGRVTPDKGSLILEALQQTATRPVEWKILDGNATPGQVLDQMRSSDVLLVPSQIVENQPTVILEAFACGLPIVGSSLGGIPETLGKAGLCVSSSVAEDWWQAIEQVLSEPRAHWSALLTEAWQRHDPERVVEALLGILRSNKNT